MGQRTTGDASYLTRVFVPCRVSEAIADGVIHADKDNSDSPAGMMSDADASRWESQSMCREDWGDWRMWPINSEMKFRHGSRLARFARNLRER